jgi:hypothetical protein
MAYVDSLGDRILSFLKLPHFDIVGTNPDGTENFDDVYLRRYYVYRGKRRPHIYLHHIIRSDYDRACHDHPWGFTSLILWGGYLEHQEMACEPDGDGGYFNWTTRRRPGTIIRHKATDLHRLELTKPAWTLVFTGPREREWGFRTTDKGWIPWKELYQYVRDMMPF